VYLWLGLALDKRHCQLDQPSPIPAKSDGLTEGVQRGGRLALRQLLGVVEDLERGGRVGKEGGV